MVMLVFVHDKRHIADEATKCIEMRAELDYLVKHWACTLVDGFAYRLHNIGSELVIACIEAR